MKKIFLALGALGVALMTNACFRSAHKDPVRHQIPDAGTIELPGRFITRTSKPEIMHATELLMAFGKRRYNIGGNVIVGEAIAFGSKSRFDSWNVFRIEAAHYLQDADWRGPAREALKWTRQVEGHTTFHRAALRPYPFKTVVAADPSSLPVWAVAFIDTTSSRTDPVQTLIESLQTYQAPQP